MPDRAPTALIAARIGRTELGEAAASLEDGALIIVLRDAHADRAIRVELATIDAIIVDDNEVSLSLRSGTHVTLVPDDPAELHDAILSHCRSLPELTSALRALGSRRGHRSVRATAADEQRKFFVPLLNARRAAGDAQSPSATIAAFDADALGKAIDHTLHKFAEQRFAEQGPGRRALEAELLDATEPLGVSLQLLRDVSATAAASLDELRPWRAWASQLRSTFETADRVWLTVDGILESSPIPQPSKKARK